jgi:phage terminase small subunit
MSEELVVLASDELANALNFQQEQFALEWLANGGNATKAAAAAGYAHPAVIGSRLLGHPGVVALIEARRAERRAEIDLALREKHLSPDRIIADLAEMAGWDLSLLLDDEGRIDRRRIKANAKQLKSVEIDGHKTKISGPDRLAAYRLLMDALGLLKPAQTNIQVNVGFAERMALRRARALEDR